MNQVETFNHIYPLHPEIGNDKRFGGVMMEGYHWNHVKPPGGGASEFTFDHLALAESTPIGPGVRQRRFWETTRATLAVNGQQASVAGFNGVIQGQFLSQPLYDPYSNQYGNIVG